MGCVGAWSAWSSCMGEDEDVRGRCRRSCRLRWVMARVGHHRRHRDEGDGGRETEGGRRRETARARRRLSPEVGVVIVVVIGTREMEGDGDVVVALSGHVATSSS